MLKIFIRITACLMLGGLASQASAASVSPAAAVPAASTVNEIILAEFAPDRGHAADRRMRDTDRRPSQRYDRDRRHGGPPSGWHQYHQRPSNWRTRGCSLIGPFWYCP